MLFRAYFADRGEDEQRRKIVIPDTAHGTNPASVTMAGYELTPVKTDARGNIDVEDLRGKVDEHTAGPDAHEPVDARPLRREHRGDPRHLPRRRRAHVLRRREPERRLRHLAAGRHGLRRRAHQPAQDVLAAARRRRPGRRPDRGAREPRAVPAGAGRRRRTATAFRLDYDRPKSIGKVRAFSGPFGVFVRSYAFMRSYGPALREMSEVAVLNANYMLARLKDAYDLPYDRLCMHEFVLSARSAEARARRQRARRREAADGLRLPSADGLLPARRARGADDRADRVGGEGDARRVLDAMLAIAREAADEPGAVRTTRRTTGRCGGSTRCARRSSPVVRFRFEEHDAPSRAPATGSSKRRRAREPAWARRPVPRAAGRALAGDAHVRPHDPRR